MDRGERAMSPRELIATTLDWLDDPYTQGMLLGAGFLAFLLALASLAAYFHL
jgi:hypothetical protein